MMRSDMIPASSSHRVSNGRSDGFAYLALRFPWKCIGYLDPFSLQDSPRGTQLSKAAPNALLDPASRVERLFAKSKVHPPPLNRSRGASKLND
jgi:hypothetical protein